MIIYGECPKCGRLELCQGCQEELNPRTNIGSGEDCFVSLPETCLPPIGENRPSLLLGYEGARS